MKIAICNGQDDVPCESADVELNNLLALALLFMTCTTINIAAFLYERHDSGESEEVDPFTSMATGNVITATSQSIERKERDAISHNEDESRNNSVTAVDDDPLNAMPNCWYKVIAKAIRTGDTLTIVLFTIVTAAYSLIASLLLLFGYRYVTGPYESNPFSWMTPFIEELNSVFPLVYGPMVFLMVNRESLYPSGRKIKKD
ncbi:uncharacterized protein LOC116923013 [Daphnia magna]|uniref:uncharacterized protein LOC116923013 n=1 Tax=Daphnia magna TaxID=35525 RepID=UPI001E1BC75E|nr:uncharacterized protein LOC116923013 [Daphnia magna]